MSDEVSQFLEQVERLRGQQIEEDEVRARELEEYLAAKRERQARREERARSISPQKSSPTHTPSPRSSRRSIYRSEALKLESPSAVKTEPTEAPAAAPEPAGDSDAMSYSSSSPTKENESPLDVDADSKAGVTKTPPTRASPLSWQRRPNSRGGGRPLSMLAAQNATQRSMTGPQEQQPASATEQTFSKDQIAQALGSKDPSWFRQTADRGASSAAYRKNQIEDEDPVDMASVKAQLPGMSVETPQKPPSRAEPSTPTQGPLASPPPLNPPRFDGAAEEKLAGDRTSVASSGKTSPVRATSPTKGVGGFVQSAMMKRSDSVKRWSVTSPPGLARVDPVVSNRNSVPQPSTRPQSRARQESATPSSSRPTSRAGEPTSEAETTPKAQPVEDAVETKSTKGDNDDSSLPSSPSKTMDPRRWSPTKSSWLESALNKPDTPRSQHKSQDSQPSWMAELNKNKASRPKSGSVSHKHQVSIGGLMRSSPMGSDAKPNTTGLGGIYSPPPGGNRPPPGHSAKLSFSKSIPKLEPKEFQEKTADSSPETKSPAEPKPESQPVEEPKEDAQPQDSERQGSVTSAATVNSPVTKSKPETPPKKDFRSGLRHRPTGSDSAKTNEPEFKSVFGNLRRTKTQNFVAPDELKDNILRGKAALNQTGGPQKTERKDEFKDAILKKKDDFKKAQSEGRGVSRSNTLTSENPLPEGLARRAEMTAKRASVSEARPPAMPVKADSTKPIPGPKRIPSGTLPSVKSPPATSSTQDSEKLERVSTQPSAKPAAEARPLPGLQKETSAPSRLQGRLGGGSLAGRFNPALAGMLARGPPPMATNGGEKETSSSSGAGAGSVSEPSAPGPQLTHMTKGRARGPKRKAPTAGSGAGASKSPEKVAPAEPLTRLVEVKKPAAAEPAREASTQNSSVKEKTSIPVEKAEESAPAPLSIQEQVAAKAVLRGRPLSTRIDTKAAEQMSPVFARRMSISPDKNNGDIPSPLKAQKTGDAGSQPGSPKKLDMKRMSRFMDDASSAPKPEPTKEPVKLTRSRTNSISPVKSKFERPLPEPEPSSPTRVDRDPAMSVKSAATKFGGAALKPSPSIAPKPSFDGPAPEAEVRAPSREPARPLPTPPVKEVPRSPPPVVTSPKQSNDVSALLHDFFGAHGSRKQYKVDAAEVLMRQPQFGAKIQSLGFQMFQISGDGKKAPVPAHNERVLFESEMYLCPHNFVNEAGWKQSEVYFWVGDAVPQSAAQDALLFVQREARSLGGKLVRTQQGKETAEFIQALGGVAIIRRGSSNRYDSLAPSMLCGRRYLGQVVFDEVNFATSSLCAGFPYLITQQGKCHLWKGRGSDVDELSCARLIGMDLTPTGELIEYDDGSEPDSFWQLFDGGLKPHSADHWRLKSNYSKYGSRLFCSNADSKQQISEVVPFNQSDLSPGHIYVLDAFFEMYIVVGSRAQSQYASFRNALDFAQEYAILAAGMEDRPFVPISTVVLEGIPRDLKSVFRKWADERSPTIINTSASNSGLKRGRSLRVVPLTQALQALSD